MTRRYCVFLMACMAPASVFAAQSASAPSDRAQLMSVYQEAVTNNSEIKAARAGFEAQKEAIPQARANLLPAITTSATIESTRLERDAPALTRVRSGTTYQANLRQPLFRADAWYGLKVAQASTSQAAFELSAAEQELILKTAETYFETLRASDTHAAAEAEEIAFKQQMDQARGRLKGGLASITDVLDAEAAYDNAQANRELAARKVDDAFEQLIRLTNHDYASIEGIEHQLPVLVPVPADAKQWVDAAMKQNLKLQASDLAVEAAEQSLSQRKAGHAPTLDAVASYRKGDNDSFGYSNPSDFGRDGYQNNVAQSSIGFEVNLPIYSGGRVSSQAREAYKKLSQSEEQREGQRREVVLNTRSFYRAVNSDIEQIRARKKTILSAQSSLKATKVGADIGSRNTVDVLNAQRQLFTSVRDYNNARYDYILNNLRLKQAAGTLSPSDLQSLAQYLKADYDPRRDFLPPEMAGANLEQPRPSSIRRGAEGL
ncbi:TolC family outer membrane protein [Pseudomonas gingeri]|uniref:TolC family outer membrane protein n=1 Tax=Pseudomonas gingeri TaxID=117681 RepID=UPI0015A4A915|nr:TolC family outer membrane protein [Pseudomonas gingeri]NWA18231.1 TolC family outer membrane protein [Pseudomonas gingeri]NWA58979.1 TolC family outer membrane protein [Pseudomonas gingeri]NWA99558.1 TolC family outer membrane protein [Pseudomonas gingeri]NWB05563.1 TolC family outer membrane protein [Pseudomonas gingeri]